MASLSDVWSQVRTFFAPQKDQVRSIEKKRFPGYYPDQYTYASRGKYYDQYSQYTQITHDLHSRYVDYENMDDYPEIACLSGESLVFTLRDGWVRIDELAETADEFWVLSYDRESGSLVPALAKNARQTGAAGHGKQMVEVQIDDGRVIRCTADHMFLKKNGTWAQAIDLQRDDRLMPGAIRIRPINGTESQGYWQVHQPHSDSSIRSTDGKRWVWMHRLVTRFTHGREFGDGSIVHHVDENTLNNDPLNLSLETCSSHAHHHIAGIDNSGHFPEWTEARRLEMAERMRGNTYRRGAKMPEEAKQAISRAMKGRVITDEHRRRIGESQPGRIDLPEHVVDAAWQKAGPSVNAVAKELGVSWRVAKNHVAKFDLASDDGNHRVFGVKEISSTDPVYDIEVPGYHNFVCNGVVVHNSALDTYADEATQTDLWKKHRIWVEGDNDNVVHDLNFMLHQQLEVNAFQWELIRYLCKYGSNYERLFVNENGVVGTEPLPVSLTRRVHDAYGTLMGFVLSRSGDFNLQPQQFFDMLQHKRTENRWQTFYSYVNSVNTFAFEDWEVSHFRIVGKDRLDEYGFAVTDPARWVFRRLVMMEDSALVHRLTRAPGRYVFYVDTGHLPPEQAIGHVQRIKDWYQRQKFVNPSTGNLDMSYNPLAVDEDFFIPVHRERGESVRVDSLVGPDYQCLTGDTVIPLLDGSEVPIQELVNRDEFWVYSVNEAGEMVPGRGHSARRTKKAEIWEIELDSGEVVRCSDNHPFMLRDGSWSRADELKPDDSLMPLYREISSLDGGDRLGGYERVFDPATGEYQYTHQLVHRWKTGSLLPQHGHVIHHANLKSKLDNRPEMLVEMDRSEHASLHIELSKHLHSPEVVAKRLKTHRSASHRKKMRELNARPEIKAAQQDRMRRRMRDPEFRERVRAGVLAFNASDFNSENIAGELNPRWREEGPQELLETIREHDVTRIRDLYDLGYSQKLVMRILANDGYDRWSDFAKEKIPGWKNNHRVVAVRRTGEEEWLYDITVDETHNFAVGQGVIVHNSVDDVDYFRKKLGRAIKIPNFGLDNDSQARPLTQEDIRFAAAILRIQQANIEGWRKVCAVHLVATNRNPFDSRWELHMSPPSAILELARMEVLSAKADVMQRLEESISVRWLLTKLFGFSEEEAVNLMVMRQEELDLIAVAEMEREAERSKMTMESEELGNTRVASMTTNERVQAKLASKVRRGALGVSEREYIRGKEPNPVDFAFRVRKMDPELAKRLDKLQETLRVMGKKVDLQHARTKW